MGKVTGKTNKFPAMITYIIAVICLLAGLFLPFAANGFGGTDDILALQLFGAADSVFGTNLSIGPSFEYYGYFTLFGILKSNVNIYAVLVLLYALITVLALLSLIPVCVSKRDTSTALGFASVIEILALLVLGLFVVCELINAYSGVLDYWKWNVVIAAGGTLLMLILQAFIYKRGSGVIKFVTLLLSAVSLLAIFGFSVNASLKNAVADLAGGAGLNPALTNGINAADNVANLFIAPSKIIAQGDNVSLKILTIAALIVGLAVIVNFMLDMIGLGKKTNKFMLVSNLIRYAVEFVALAVAAILVPVSGYSFGLMIIFIGAAVIIQLVITIIRLCVYAKNKKKSKTTETAETEYTVVADAPAAEAVSGESAAAYESEIAPAQASYTPVRSSAPIYAPAPAPAPAYTPVAAKETAPEKTEQEKVETHNVIYNVNTIYNGPTDAFINKLTNDEKMEFAKVFLERNVGNLSNIPTYDVGGDNRKFFSAVFIYFGKVRDLVSDGLMNKLYEQVNMIH